MIGALFRHPVILAYHGVGPMDDVSDPKHLVVSPDHLAAHIRFLQGRGYRFASAEDVIGGHPPKNRTAVLTFDDGWSGWVSYVLPLLERFGIPATFYVCPGLWGHQHPDVAGELGRLITNEEAMLLCRKGMELGSHSMTHPDLRSMGDDSLTRELTESKRMIEEISGRPCRTFAYPFGLYDERVIKAVGAAGYELALGWVPGPWSTYQVPRLAGPPRHGARRLALKMLGIRRRTP